MHRTWLLKLWLLPTAETSILKQGMQYIMTTVDQIYLYVITMQMILNTNQYAIISRTGTRKKSRYPSQVQSANGYLQLFGQFVSRSLWSKLLSQCSMNCYKTWYTLSTSKLDVPGIFFMCYGSQSADICPWLYPSIGSYICICFCLFVLFLQFHCNLKWIAMKFSTCNYHKVVRSDIFRVAWFTTENQNGYFFM